jgi:hypothetical protein
MTLMLGCAAGVQYYDALELRTFTDSIGYETVAEARAALSSRQDVTISTGDDGSIRIREQRGAAETSYWWFVAADHPTYPMAVVITQGPSKWERRIRCEAAPVKCEQWIREIQIETQRMLDEI